MMKMMKRASIVSSPAYDVDHEAKNRFKMQTLKQDFDEIQKETIVLKRTVRGRKQRKLTLLAEVQFLRRRYKYLLKNQYRQTELEQVTEPRISELEKRVAASVKDEKYKEKEVAIRRSPPILDLNKISDPTEESGDDYQALQPMRMNKKLKRNPIQGEASATDLTLSICRNVGNGSNRTGKKKITWQDQINVCISTTCDGRIIAVKRLANDNTDHSCEEACMENGLHLIFNFSPNGTLASALHGKSGDSLAWSVRYKIVLGIARGLHYLHKCCKHRIIHRDIKASNVLLGPDFEPQISNFVLASLTLISTNASHGTYLISPSYRAKTWNGTSSASEIGSTRMALELIERQKLDTKRQQENTSWCDLKRRWLE